MDQTNCGKFLKRWEYQITLLASWETCMQVKKQQLEPDMEQWTGSKIGNGVCQGCILSPCLFNLYAEYIMWNVKLDEAQTGIKTARRNINKLRCEDDTTLMGESEEELKRPSLDESERGEWKSWLKTQHLKNKVHGIQSHHFMANTWGKIQERVTYFVFLGSKITADGDCSYEIKRCLSLEEKLWQTLTAY